MKEHILDLIERKPKHYTVLIKKDPTMLEWVYANSIIDSDRLADHVYSAINQVSNICPYGNVMKLPRYSIGFVCSPTCQCTKEAISASVIKAKANVTDAEKLVSNVKREHTMKEKYGVAFNSQRPEIKDRLATPKVTDEVYKKLMSYEWMYEEYVIKARNLSDIADELGVYYGTVGEYCRTHGFVIRRVTNYSTEERQIAEYILSLGFDVITNDWEALGSAEIDIYVPSLKFGIEVDGLYWHSYHPSNKKAEDKTRHLTKSRIANELGVSLIHVTDYEWNNKREIIENMIKSKLGLNERIYARKCEIRELDTGEQRSFINKFHLQGYTAASFAYGLFYDNVLQMVITLGTSRFNKTYDLEVLRVCSRAGITVVGGLSKLMKYIQKAHMGQTIVTYCDSSKSSGNGYRQVGFEYIGHTDPGYFWTNGSDMISRYKCQKKNLQKWLPRFDHSMTERENMFSNNYRIFWDCGHQQFVYKC